MFGCRSGAIGQNSELARSPVKTEPAAETWRKSAKGHGAWRRTDYTKSC